MEATPLPTTDNENWAEQYDQSLNQQRDRIREFLSAQQERLQRVENELGDHLQRLAEELVDNRDESQRAGEDLEQQRQKVARETENLELLKQELADKQAQWEQLHQQAENQQQGLLEQIRQQQADLDRRHEDLQRRQTEINDAEAELHQQQHALQLTRGEHEAQRQQLAEQRSRLDAKQAELDAQAAEIATARAEIESRRARLEKDLEEAGERTETRGQLADSEQLDRVEAERDMLRVKLAAAEEQLGETRHRPDEAPQGGAAPADDDMKRRYEMAMEDVRELKAENARLQERLAAAPDGRAAAAAPAAAGGALDWEAEKQRILASLEDDYDQEDEEDCKERLKIEELIEKTDRLLAEKDEEIADLKQLLETQSAKVGSVAVGAAVLGEMLDDDAVVREERESLKLIQEEWREKLRKAEVDISLERAKLARERADLEEKLRLFEHRGGSLEDSTDEDDDPEKPARGKWLSRLGLGNEEEE